MLRAILHRKRHAQPGTIRKAKKLSGQNFFPLVEHSVYEVGIGFQHCLRQHIPAATSQEIGIEPTKIKYNCF